MNPYRLSTEYSVIMQMSKVSICQQDSLDSKEIKEEFNEEYPCHIYFICRRPRVLIVPELCEFGADTVKFVFKIQKGFNFDIVEYVLKSNLDCSNFTMKSDYHGTHFTIFDGEDVVVNGKSSVFITSISHKQLDELDLEVLYVGQSYGVDGARTSPQRLKQHSTLQNIYSESISRNPDKEIWLALLSFRRVLITSFDGINKYPEDEKDRDVQRAAKMMHTFMNNHLNEQQVINFTEAALIKYFKPIYNIEYKETFPNPAHKTYSECYDLDVNSVGIELDSECIRACFYSGEVPARFTHLGSFTLNSKQDRKNMFDLDFKGNLGSRGFNIKIE